MRDWVKGQKIPFARQGKRFFKNMEKELDDKG
jgi:hypothetical protein